MKPLKVNAESIESMAAAIYIANDNINGSFEALKIKGKELDNCWNSKAGSQAATLMHQLFKGNEARSAVLRNHVDYLRYVVNSGYMSAEECNTSLADRFL